MGAGSRLIQAAPKANIGKMEHFQLKHPPDRIVTCDYMACGGVADYLEVNEEGHEYFVCADHTSIETHTSRLSERAPGDGYPYQNKPAA